MLERASTCLENGARASLRTARQKGASKRRLHAAFWTHTAFDLDLATLVNTSVWESKKLPHDSRIRRGKTESARVNRGDAQDTVFLDFLYPRQALAWLRSNAAPSFEVWETRNVRRLPAGYIHASRRYSSMTDAQQTSAKSTNEEDISVEDKAQYRHFAMPDHDDDAMHEQDTDTSDAWDMGRHRPVASSAADDKLVNGQHHDLARTVHSPSQHTAATPTTFDLPDDINSWNDESDLGHAASPETRESTVRITYEPQTMPDEETPRRARPFGLDNNMLVLDQAESYQDSLIMDYTTTDDGLQELEDALDISKLPTQEFIASTIEKLRSAPGGFDTVVLQRFLSIAKRRLTHFMAEETGPYTEAVQSLYNELPSHKKDRHVNEAVLRFYNYYHNDSTDNDMLDIYNSIPSYQRSANIYKYGIGAFFRCGLLGLASQAYHDASMLDASMVEASIARHPDPSLPAWYLTHALMNSRWDVARHFYLELGGSGDAILGRIRWRMDPQRDPLPQAYQFAMYLRGNRITLDTDDALWRLFLAFSKAAIVQDLRLNFLPRVSGRNCRIDMLEETCDCVYQLEDRKLQDDFFIPIFDDVTKPSSEVDFYRIGRLTAMMAERWLLPPREEVDVGGHTVLMKLLWQYMIKVMDCTDRYSGNSDAFRWPHMNIIDLIDARQRLNKSQLPRNEIAILLGFFARHGDVQEVQRWSKEYVTAKHWSISRYEDAMANTIEVFAARHDAAAAKLTFDKLAHDAQQSTGEPLGVPYWNALIKAYTNAEEITLAQAVIDEMIEAGHTPDTATLQPLLDYLASRGDQRGIDALLARYERTGMAIPTQHIGTYVKAWIVNRDIPAAESFLATRLLPALEKGQLEISTEPFNLVLRSLARHHGSAALLAFYQQMQQLGVPMNAETYASFTQVYAGARDTTPTLQMLRPYLERLALRPTALHYGIAMEAMLATAQPLLAIQIYEDMKEGAVSTSPLVEKYYVAALEQTQSVLPGTRGAGELKSQLDLMLAEILQPHKRHIVFPAIHDVDGRGSLADTTGAILEILGRNQQHEVIREFIPMYIRSRKSVALSKYTRQRIMPIEVLNGLMSANVNNEQWDGVRACWVLAQKIQKLNTIYDPQQAVEYESLRRLESDMQAGLGPESSQAGKETANQATIDPQDDENTMEPSSAGLQCAEGESSSIQMQLNDQSPASRSSLDLSQDDELDAVLQHALFDKHAQPLAETKVDAKLTSIPSCMAFLHSSRHLLGPSSSRFDRMLNPALGHQITMLARQNDINGIINTIYEYLQSSYTLDGDTANLIVQRCLETSPPLVFFAFALTERILMRDFKGWDFRGYHDQASSVIDAQLLMRYQKYGNELRRSPHYKTMVLLSHTLLKMRHGEIEEAVDEQDAPPHAGYVGTFEHICAYARRTWKALKIMPKLSEEPLQMRYLVPYGNLHTTPYQHIAEHKLALERARQQRNATLDDDRPSDIQSDGSNDNNV